MFNWEDFKNGNCYVRINNYRDFEKFLHMCGERGICFVNGKVCGTETLSIATNTYRNQYYVNESGVRRFTEYQTNYYIAENGFLRKKTSRSSSLSGKERFSYEDIMLLESVDENGFEKEFY